MEEISDKLLNEKAEKLEDDLKKINNRIEKHPDTEPNFYELANSWIRFGEVVYEKCLYYDKVGYPYNLANNRPYTSYEIARVDSNLSSCYSQMEKMEQLIDVFSHPLLKDEDIRSLYQEEIIHDSVTGYMSYQNDYKELLCKCISVPFYIYQETKKNPHFQYENKEEFFQMTTTFLDMSFADDDQRTILIGSILNKINQRSIWYKPDMKDLYLAGKQGIRKTEGRKY